MDSRTGQRVRLSVDVEPELRKRLKIVATERDTTMHEYVVAILRRALAEAEHERTEAEGTNWTRLSTRAFARDWESDADQAYDGRS